MSLLHGIDDRFAPVKATSINITARLESASTDIDSKLCGGSCSFQELFVQSLDVQVSKAWGILIDRIERGKNDRHLC
jgi:hypothetical protein